MGFVDYCEAGTVSCPLRRMTTKATIPPIIAAPPTPRPTPKPMASELLLEDEDEGLEEGEGGEGAMYVTLTGGWNATVAASTPYVDEKTLFV